MVGQERKSRKGVLYTAISVIALGTGIGGAYLIFGTGGTSQPETQPPGQTELATQAANGGGQPEAGQPGVPAESTAIDTTTVRDTQSTPQVTPPAPQQQQPAQPVAPRTGTLVLERLPRDASVYAVLVDDERHNESSIDLAPGLHTVKIRQRGYLEFQRDVRITAGRTERVTYAGERISAPPETPTRPSQQQPPPAAPATAELRIVILNATPEIFLDNLSLGQQRRLQGLQVDAGRHTLRFELEGFVTKDTNIVVNPGQPVTVRTSLTRNP